MVERCELGQRLQAMRGLMWGTSVCIWEAGGGECKHGHKQERGRWRVVQCRYSALCGEKVWSLCCGVPSFREAFTHPSEAACALIATNVHYCFQLPAWFEFFVLLVVSPVACSHYPRVELHSC